MRAHTSTLHKTITNNHGSVQYLNSGDWIENLTALEYDNNTWNIFHYESSKLKKQGTNDDDFKDVKELFLELSSDFKM